MAVICAVNAHLPAVPVTRARVSVCNCRADADDAAMIVGETPRDASGMETEGPATEWITMLAFEKSAAKVGIRMYGEEKESAARKVSEEVIR